MTLSIIVPAILIMDSYNLIYVIVILLYLKY